MAGPAGTPPVHKPPATNPPPAAADDEEPLDAAGSLVDDRLARIVEHPDGFYWIAPDERQEFGPFETLEEALADMEIDDSEDAVELASLAETEQALGIAEWIDPDTGEPAEESRPRLEDH